MTTTRHRRLCTFCEATCGVLVDVVDGNVVDVSGDRTDPFSRGYHCVKSMAIRDGRIDPDLLTSPVHRDGGAWSAVSWERVLDDVGRRIARIRDRYGADAVAVYLGNPTVYDYATVFFSRFLLMSLGTANRYSAASLDGLPHTATSYLMFGNQFLIPVPDVDRTDLLLVLGANPIVSNGSVMTAPGIGRRLHGLRRRGGSLVVVDPRRTETARVADRHLPIVPGTDFVLLAGLLHVILRDTRPVRGRREVVAALDSVRELVRDVDEHVAAGVTGIAAEQVALLANEFAAARRAVCYARLGVCHQPSATVTLWLVNVLNAVTGNLDAVGGAMFTCPAVDVAGVAPLLRERGGFGRAGDGPSFAGERPVSALADRMESDGPDRIRALITVGGNLARSAPSSSRLERCLDGLELYVAVDPYLNETTCRADYVLPPAPLLTRDQYPVVPAMVAVRNVAKYTPPVFAPAPSQRAEWEILNGLHSALARHRSDPLGPLDRAFAAACRALGPRRMLDAALRVGPHGLRRGRGGLSLTTLRRHPEGVDLGPLIPMLLRRRVRVRMLPPVVVAHARALLASAGHPGEPDGTLALIGRRQRRSANGWLHNVAGIASERERCTLLIHPEDAALRGVRSGDTVRVTSERGAVEVEASVTYDMRPGVVSLPHGWGHDEPRSRLKVARRRAGANMNALTDERLVDSVTGTAAFCATRVTVAPSTDLQR